MYHASRVHLFVCIIHVSLSNVDEKERTIFLIESRISSISSGLAESEKSNLNSHDLLGE